MPVIIGTNREKRRSYFAAKLVAEVGASVDGVVTELIDPQNFYFAGDGNDPNGKDGRYSDLTARADGFFIVTPEYNHSFPGSLKRMLDSEFENYRHKPVALGGVSDGIWGGVRAIESLVNAVREMGLVATWIDVNFPRVQDLFDEHGNLLDEEYRKRILKSWQELIWMARALKAARG